MVGFGTNWNTKTLDGTNYRSETIRQLLIDLGVNDFEDETKEL